MNYIENVDKLDSESLRDPELYHELMECESDFDRETAYLSVRERAKSLGLTKQFDTLYQAMKREYAKQAKVERIRNAQIVGSGLTDFDFLDEQFRCGEWVANNNGIGKDTPQGFKMACYNPICPTKVLRNVETGKYKTELTFKIRDRIHKIYVDREILISANKITKLASDSLEIVGNGAALLAEYLSLVEHNGSVDGLIKEYTSTSRLGWIETPDKKKYFLPYQSDEIVFDGESNMRTLFDSITSYGSRDKWYSYIKKIRKWNYMELLIYMASSFASVLIEPCNALPFIVCLWGNTGAGKTCCLKVATSIWADPGEGKYISDAKGTTTGMEMRLNILNSLPMALDDMAQIQDQEENFSSLIYRWCAGKGRDRSNKELGLNKLTSWRNCTLTNGERSLVDDYTQGGAVNRVIDIEATRELFNVETGNEATRIVESNYGFAGQEFVNIIREIGFDEINRIVRGYSEQIRDYAKNKNVEKEGKQIIPMALILAADEISEKYLFKDGIRLDIAKCIDYLKNRGEVSEGTRGYAYLVDTIVSNSFRFEDDVENSNIERWGYWEERNKVVAIIGTQFDRMAKAGNFQPKAFFSWAKSQNLIRTDDKGNFKKVVWFHDKSVRAVVLDITKNVENTSDDGFMDADGIELPF